MLRAREAHVEALLYLVHLHFRFDLVLGQPLPRPSSACSVFAQNEPIK